MQQKNNSAIAIFIFLIISILYCLPVLQNIHYWGQRDWDQFTFWNAVPRDTILRYHQFPLWDPYVNGGNVMLAHPHSSFLSPFYIFVMIFGPVIGLKIEIIVHLFIGLTGMYFLGKHLELGERPSYLSAFVFMLSSIYALHITEGHAEWLTMGFVPWFFMYYLKSLINRKSVIGAVITFSLIILGGGVHVSAILLIFVIIFAILESIQERCFNPTFTLSIILLATLCFCAIKLLPMMEFLHQNPREYCYIGNDYYGTPIPTLFKMFFFKKQVLLYELAWKAHPGKHLWIEGWHEYGSYVGIMTILLFMLGMATSFKKNWPLILTGLFCLLIVMGCESPINFWGLLHNLPIYHSLRVPARYTFGFIFSVAILSGYGLSALEKLTYKYINSTFRCETLISTIIVSVVMLDLFYINSQILYKTFIIPPVVVARNNFFTQKYRAINFFGNKLTNSSQYPVLLSNSGILESYDIVHVPQGDISCSSDTGYKGEVYSDNAEDVVSLNYFSPNKATATITAQKLSRLILNQNFSSEWKVIRNQSSSAAEPYNGLISTKINPGTHKVTFIYLPLSFIVGLALSACSFLLAGITMLKYCFKSSKTLRERTLN